MQNQKLPKLDESRLTPEQRDKLDDWQRDTRQLEVLEDIADMLQEVVGSSDKQNQSSDSFGALLLDIRESLAAISHKEAPETPDYAKPVTDAIKKLETALTASMKALDVKPVVKVDAPQVTVENTTPTVDLKGVEKLLKTDLPKAFQAAIAQIPHDEPDFQPLLQALEGMSEQLVSIEHATRSKPSPGSMKISNSSDYPVPVTNETLDTISSRLSTLNTQTDALELNTTGLATSANQTNKSQITQAYDPLTNRYLHVDQMGNLRTAEIKRVLGSGFGSSIDTTYLYTVTVGGTGAVAASSGAGSLTTGATANSTALLVTKNKARYLSGRANIFRGLFRFDAGATNNVREFGVYMDSSNKMVFRLSGTTFSVVVQRAGSETVVTSGSFNGNGTASSGTYVLDTNFHVFEILYTTSSIRFIIDETAIHRFVPTTTSLIASLVGTLYASNANSGGGTSNVALDVLAWSVSHVGNSVNNPSFYNINAAAETRTLKGGGGTLQSISIGRTGGANCTLTIYDNTAGSGTILGIWDANATQSVGTHLMGIEGVNFYTGLTYVSSGTWTNGSVTLFWE